VPATQAGIRPRFDENEKRFHRVTEGMNQPRFIQAGLHGLARLIPYSGSKFPNTIKVCDAKKPLTIQIGAAAYKK